MDIRDWRDAIMREKNGGRRVRKPRSNSEAVDFWAAHALVPECVANSGDTNSIIITRDVVYSFGHHFPMGRICRNVRGECVEIVVNKDYYPVRGWADTPGDHWNVKIAAQQVESISRGRIKVREAWLSSYNLPNGVPIIPRADDPEPEVFEPSVPKRFHAYEPGPEPVDTERHLCVAGTVEHYSYAEDEMVSTSEEFAGVDTYMVGERLWNRGKPGEFTYWRRYTPERKSLYRRTMVNGVIVWGSENYAQYDDTYRSFDRTSRVEYKQCLHCQRFRNRHDRWDAYMNGKWFAGQRWPSWSSREAALHAYGGWEGWLEAWRADRAKVVQSREAHAAWVERNYIPLSAVSRDAHGVPRLVDGTHAMRKDGENYLKGKRERAREQRRLERAERAHMRERRAVEKFKARVRARREAQHARTFEGTAQRIMLELSAMRSAIPELESNDTPGG
jgi:hypothetical protein